MNLLSAAYLLRVFLAFVRISGFFMAAPFFGQTSFPIRIRVLLSALLAYAFGGLLVQHPLPPHITSAFGFIAALLVEALTGLLLGFTAQFIFWAIQFAGEIMGFQMALGMAQVFNPVSGQTSNPLGRFLTLTFLLIFVLLGGHHELLRALYLSFEVVPLGGAKLAAGGPLLMEWTGDFFTTAVRLAAPFMITIFFIDLTLGIFARIAPQADLFSLSLPLKLMGGLFVFFYYLQYLMPIIPDLSNQITDQVLEMLKALQEGLA